MKTLKTLPLIGLLAILAAIGAVVYFFGGLYSVAASAEEPAFVKWALVQVRQASIERHAKDRPAISLDDPATVQAGARAFSERGLYRTMISRPGPLSLDAPSRLNHRAFASVINLVPLESAQ